MATAKAPSPVVHYDEGSDTYSVGFKLDGVFVPLASKNGGYVRGLAASGETTEDDDADEKGGDS